MRASLGGEGMISCQRWPGGQYADPKEERRKSYRSPRLVRWGTLHELTHGLLNPDADFPFVGGSTPT